jgi:hypothetical protein
MFSCINQHLTKKISALLSELFVTPRSQHLCVYIFLHFIIPHFLLNPVVTWTLFNYFLEFICRNKFEKNKAKHSFFIKYQMILSCFSPGGSLLY